MCEQSNGGPCEEVLQVWMNVVALDAQPGFKRCVTAGQMLPRAAEKVFPDTSAALLTARRKEAPTWFRLRFSATACLIGVSGERKPGRVFTELMDVRRREAEHLAQSVRRPGAAAGAARSGGSLCRHNRRYRLRY